MQPVRFLVLRHPVLLAAMLACALLTRILIPAGYMPMVSAGGVTLTLCSGTTPAPPTAASMPDMHHAAAPHYQPDKESKAEQPCAFAGLGLQALGAADPVLLAAALAFAFLLVLFGTTQQPPAPPARLRPPLRAPPLTV